MGRVGGRSVGRQPLNQNLLHTDTAPVARELEQIVVGWFAPYFGMDGGHLVPGSTLANLTALWAARELCGRREVVASEAAHLSVRKAAAVLGLDFRAVPVDERQRLREPELGDLSRAALVLTAGTTVTGAVDPLAAGLGDAAWRHVDAAWAGPLRLSRALRRAARRDRRRRFRCDLGPQMAVSTQGVGTRSVRGRRARPFGALLRWQLPGAAQPRAAGLARGGGAAGRDAAGLGGEWGMAARIDACMAIAERLCPCRCRPRAPRAVLGPGDRRGGVRPAGVTGLPGLREGLQNAFVSLTTVAAGSGCARWRPTHGGLELVVEAVVRATLPAPTRSS